MNSTATRTMMTDDHDREKIDELRNEVAALAARLEAVTIERNEALREIERLRSGGRLGSAGDRQDALDIDPSCEFCDGEGRYWVHDFEMVCRRCNGTGVRPEQPA